uniref:Isopenicillin N synthase-like Fe(2+) 2OG dioxygenase domain-containing protein n=1 Tax=Triticum urartu TaxID=4572 RepID=A0A8R7US98_TRIUA
MPSSATPTSSPAAATSRRAPTNPLYEAFGLYDAASPADVDAFCASLHAPPHIRETIRRYAEKTHELIVDVAAKLAVSLGLEEPEADRMFQDWPCRFRINRYNYTPDTVGETGVQVHTDSGFLTVLHEDDRVGGLEVADPGTGEFAPVDPSQAPSSSTSATSPRVGVEQRGAAQREAPRAVCGGGAAGLHRALLAGAQGRRGPRAGRLRRRRQPPPLQDFRLRRLPPAPAVHRGACRRGPGAVGRVIHQLNSIRAL